MMKLHSLVVLLICSAIRSPVLIADGYPESYIARQLRAAQTPIDVNVASLKPGQLMAIEYVDMPVLDLSTHYKGYRIFI